ncbi:hypothetical protein C0992_008914 [Termitomyces sp. T32_za158]|nr:hypothetical protein C0992_008914 [Termitomyces sp. T32_za158]
MNKAYKHNFIIWFEQIRRHGLAERMEEALCGEKVLQCELRGRARVERRCGVELVCVRLDKGCALEYGGGPAGGDEVDRDSGYFEVLREGGRVVVKDLSCAFETGKCSVR